MKKDDTKKAKDGAGDGKPGKEWAALAPEVMPKGTSMSLVISDETKVKVTTIMRQVVIDINNAELGKFYSLRAGIGLIATKNFIPRGMWGDFLRESFQNKSIASAYLYMKKAGDFFAKFGGNADESWTDIYGIETDFMNRAASQLMLPAGGKGGDLPAIPKREIPAIIRKMAEFLTEEDGGDGGGGGGKEPPRPLSAAERRQAAADTWQGIVAKATQEAVSRRSWMVLPLEEQENIGAALRTASEEIMREVRRAKDAAKGKK